MSFTVVEFSSAAVVSGMVVLDSFLLSAEQESKEKVKIIKHKNIENLRMLVFLILQIMKFSVLGLTVPNNEKVTDIEGYTYVRTDKAVAYAEREGW